MFALVVDREDINPVNSWAVRLLRLNKETKEKGGKYKTKTKRTFEISRVPPTVALQKKLKIRNTKQNK